MKTCTNRFSSELISVRRKSRPSKNRKSGKNRFYACDDGVFDYNNEIWTDSFGKAIPDKLWENSTWLRKEFHV